MKDRVCEESVLNVCAEVLAGNRRFFIEKFGFDFAVAGFDRDHDISQVKMCGAL